MPGLTLFSGNRLEILADKFAELISASPLNAMIKEKVVVQSMGMMKWLTVEMSRRLGIWANYDYVIPNKITESIFNSFFPGKGDKRYFDNEIMIWKCADVIIKEINNPVFSELSVYLRNDFTGLKLYQIASKIVYLFDQYMTFRPDMIMDWDNGVNKRGWQSELWRELTKGMKGDHPPAMLYKIYDILKAENDFKPEGMPERITVFGISYLTMYHMNILRAASLYSDINFFILNPSPEYWGNILTNKERQKIISTSPLLPGEPEDYLHTEEGNALLASLGRSGRDFLHNIFMSDLDTEGLFEEPQRRSLLSMIQNDIYNMNNGAADSEKSSFIEKDIFNDGSVTVNSCHSLMREVEVLHDYILDLMNKDRSLTPGDILVMSPDIEEYSSSIHGIFGKTGDGIPYIPYRIVDRKIKNDNIAVETFFKVLSLPDERFTSTYVLSIIGCSEIMDKFGLNAEDVDLIGLWVRETLVYWGIDAEYKEELDLPKIHENTWQFGLNRMLLGGIMDNEGEISLGILPYSGIEGHDLQVLGKFISFFKSLRSIYTMLKEEYSLADWSGVINCILDSLFSAGEIPEALLSIYEASLKLKSSEEEISSSRKINLTVIREYFDNVLTKYASGMNFVSGSLTFCEMLPMRSIPCRAICIIGMNDSSFPRKSRGLSFDLTAVNPRRGDRSISDEDKYLFLEILVSARDYLYISYTGQSMDSNIRLNPSVVVTELLEYIDEHYSADEGESIMDYIFREHRIQPYNPVYFISESGFFTYRKSIIEGAKSYAKPEKGHYIFIDKPLPPLENEEKTITINQLANFLFNPSRYLLKNRLGLHLELGSGEFIKEEPFILNSLEQYNLNLEIMQAVINGKSFDEHFEIIRGEGVLPHGTLGRELYDRSFSQVKAFYSRFSHVFADKNDKIELSLKLNGFNLIASLDNIFGGRLIFFRYASTKGIDLLNAWIANLVLCASGLFSEDTISVSKNGISCWGYIPNSMSLLAKMLTIYEKGMARPIPLFPKSSYEYANTFYNSRNSEPDATAMKKAASAFDGRYYLAGDCHDPYIKKFFTDFSQCSSEFLKLTHEVYFPVFENMKNEASM